MLELNDVWITFHRRPHRTPHLPAVAQYPTTRPLQIPKPAAAESCPPTGRFVTIVGIIGAQRDVGGTECPMQPAPMLPPCATRRNKVLQPEGRLIPLLPVKPPQRCTQFRVTPRTQLFALPVRQ